MARWIEPAAWWTALFGCYLALISAVSPIELVVGAVAAVPGAAVAVLTRRALLPGAGRAPRRVPLRALRLLPVQIVVDAARLVRPRVPATFATVTDEGGPVALVLSISPGTYVVDADTEEDRLTVHRVGTRPDRLERALTREDS
jgi:multisubunit Na+/H+ antiporter MnhE subunit